MRVPEAKDFGNISHLSGPKFPSPLKAFGEEFVSDSDRILKSPNTDLFRFSPEKDSFPPSFELAGPRDTNHFTPKSTRVAVVTCGGLCPGLNNILRALVLELHHRYGVRSIQGIRFGLQGFIPEYGHFVQELTPSFVERILDMGGSVLGSSRGPQDFERITDWLEENKINLLFMVGGDGTLTAAHLLCRAIRKRNLDLALVGIPKTIDNDIPNIDRSFGFDTAVEEAARVIRCAHTEAVAYPNGIGLIKLMGRHSGFIAATAALAQQDANFVLVPEAPFDLEGEGGLLSALKTRLEMRGHALIVVAEGAGQNYCGGQNERDLSGNRKLSDIGLFLKDRIGGYFSEKNIAVSMKYFDPGYMIRSLPANANDAVFCSFLARNAVHAAMAGKTEMLVGYLNGHFIHLPLSLCAGQRKHLDPRGRLWRAVLEATGQGALRSL
ncbi:ATP-dependent 6-phosphofructokinase [Desulfococcaceae bacterium OttesenSCG-928-F15]|nr:ATP-dependent 6-phosphofructokinase [Desulfococcaceae bacterium OttesenSCG-928-F15]